MNVELNAGGPLDSLCMENHLKYLSFNPLFGSKRSQNHETNGWLSNKKTLQIVCKLL